MYLSIAKMTIEKMDTDSEMVEITFVTRHMNSPRDQYCGEIAKARIPGTQRTIDSMSDRAMLKRNRLVTLRMSFLLMITMQTSALPE